MRLLCLGDSITDCGRNWEHPPLGNGYVKMIADDIGPRDPDFEVVNLGTDGFTLARVADVVRQMAGFSAVSGNHSHMNESGGVSGSSLCYDIVTLLAGINDIALMMNTRRTALQQKEMLEKFLQNYTDLIHILTVAGKPTQSHARLILMEPFIFPWPAEFAAWVPHVRVMSAGIAAIAQKYELPFLRLHDRLNLKALEHGMSAVTPDGIHLTARGHRILADTLLPLLD